MPTDDEMSRAYAQVAKRDWPTLDELKRSAMRYELVLGQATRRARPLSALSRVLHQTEPAKAAPAVPALPPRAAPGSFFDLKRAASGERPDDE